MHSVAASQPLPPLVWGLRLFLETCRRPALRLALSSLCWGRKAFLFGNGCSYLEGGRRCPVGGGGQRDHLALRQPPVTGEQG